MRRSMSMALALTLPVTRPHRAPVWLRKATYRKTVQNLWWATGPGVIAMPPPAEGRPLETSAEEEQAWDSLHCIQAADARVLRQEDTRMLLEKTLATLASLVTQHLPLALGGVLVLGALCLCWLCEKACTSATWKVHMASTWVVRKGACPCCGSPLFGTTAVYHRLSGLDRECPESPYLCLICDQAKVAALQQHYRADGVDA